ncbi:hypothetical protein [Azospirillum palustre]
MLARFHDLFTLLAGRLGGGSRPPLPDLGGWPDLARTGTARFGTLRGAAPSSPGLLGRRRLPSTLRRIGRMRNTHPSWSLTPPEDCRGRR